MSAFAATIVTAGITPERFPEQIMRLSSRTLVASALVLLVFAGFGFRAYRLGAEGLSEDELNKVRAVEQYRAHGLTSANGEHPLLMKALLTGSLIIADRWNTSIFAGSNPALRLSTETAVRLPGTGLGALTALLLFLVASELFGIEIGLLAAALWAFDPQAIGFNRIAKEDTFLLFFFLLANVFWLRGQRVAEAGRFRQEMRPEKNYWLAAAAFGAMMASKYLPHLFAISISYYWIFQGVKTARWRLGKSRWLLFFAIMGAAFLICNPTILLPGTWHEMKIFAGEKRIGHDSYEFLGKLYRNQMSLWLKGSPWYFYYVFMGVKLPVLTLVAFVAGLPMLFLKRLGDGRYFVLFWIFFWFFPFTVLGGKFTRYFTFAMPAVLLTAAIGVHAAAAVLARIVAHARNVVGDVVPRPFLHAALAGLIIALSAYASAHAAPHYRLYTNALIGGGESRAGSYFPHDEFYDSSVREVATFVARGARPGARVASETPELFTYYARQADRFDLVAVSLSDRTALRTLTKDDFIIVARGRRYFSNDVVVNKLRAINSPVARLTLGVVPSIEIFVLNDETHAVLMDVLNKFDATSGATARESAGIAVP